MPGLMAVQYCGVDTLTVVTDAQLKLPVVVSDLHFNSTSACMPEGIAQGLAADPMDVVLDDWAKGAQRAMDGDIKGCCVRVRVADRRRCELFAKRAEGDGQIVRGRRGRAQALDGIPSLPD